MFKQPKVNPVIYLTKKSDYFSNKYLAVREKEQRVLSVKDLLKLPYLDQYEWKLRAYSSEQFMRYITKKTIALELLDIGCGNGWFSSRIAKSTNSIHVTGLDINDFELEQAVSVFKEKNLQFVYGDIFKLNAVFTAKFDIITLNASIQYFSDLDELIKTLKSFLKPKGEIHILDSPFYKESEVLNAKKRTEAYYKSLGFPEMSEHYFHHSIEKLKQNKPKTLYQPTFFNKIVRKKQSPFFWYRIVKS